MALFIKVRFISVQSTRKKKIFAPHVANLFWVNLCDSWINECISACCHFIGANLTSIFKIMIFLINLARVTVSTLWVHRRNPSSCTQYPGQRLKFWLEWVAFFFLIIIIFPPLKFLRNKIILLTLEMILLIFLNVTDCIGTREMAGDSGIKQSLVQFSR